MIYRILADITIVMHLFWILFLILGFIFALKRSRITVIHGAGLLFVLILNLMGWYCPLTYLENYLHTLYDANTTYAGSFIRNYVEQLIYLRLPERHIRNAGIVFVVFYGIVYAYFLRKYRREKRIKA